MVIWPQPAEAGRWHPGGLAAAQPIAMITERYAAAAGPVAS